VAQLISNEQPEGFQYIPDFLSVTEEHQVLQQIEGLNFETVRMHDVVAKRRVLHFGWLYGYESWQLTAGPPVPEWLMPLRERVASLISVPPMELEQVLISQYLPGSGIGWHRDAPMFGPTVAGLSLRGHCRFRFQRKRGEIRDVSECLLEPRSAYLLSGPSRSAWQHCIPPTKSLRYSITFRTLKDA